MTTPMDPEGAIDAIKELSAPRIDATSKLGKKDQLLLQKQVLLANHIQLLALEMDLTPGELLTKLYPLPEPTLYQRAASLAQGLGLTVHALAGILHRDGCIDEKQRDYLRRGDQP